MSTRKTRSGAVGGGTEAQDAVEEEGQQSTSNAKSKDKGKGKAKSTSTAAVVTPAKIEAERSALLSEKQTELAAVLDRHDDLIREKFHMETFLMMVDYNPEVAKQDDSKVFQDYKSKYDLLETATPASSSMSPRKTRSAHASAAAAIAAQPVAGPSNSNSSAAGPSASPAKSPKKMPNANSRIIVVKPKPKPKPEVKTKSARSISVSAPVAIGSRSSSRTSKGKGKERAEPVPVPEDAPQEVDGGGGEAEPESISVGLARARGRAGTSASASVNGASASGTTRHLRKRPGAPSPPPPSASANGSAPAGEAEPPRKKRKVEVVDGDGVVSASAAVAVVSTGAGGTDATSASALVRVLRGGRGAPVRSELKSKAKPKAGVGMETPLPPTAPANANGDAAIGVANGVGVGGKSITATAPPVGRVMPHRSAAHRPQVSAPLPHRRAQGAAAAIASSSASASTSALPPSATTNTKGKSKATTTTTSTPNPNPSTTTSTRKTRTKPAPPPAPATPNAKTKPPSAPPTPSNIKRIHLLVRRPPPKHLSHPAQRPPPPRFGSSVGRALGSWVVLPDGGEYAVENAAVSPIAPSSSLGGLNGAAGGLGPNGGVGAAAGAGAGADLSTSTGTGTGPGNTALARRAYDEAVLWERVEAMKRAGQWFGSDVFDSFRAGGSGQANANANFNTNANDAVAAGMNGANGADAPGSASVSFAPLPSAAAAAGTSTATAPRGLNAPPTDTWAAVVRAVIAHGRRARSNTNASSASASASQNYAKRTAKSRGAVIAAQVASKIQGYWDGEAAKVEKGRVVEERRLRGVAKSVGKLVLGEWKKAVWHIREQERMKYEAEELKRGHEHLDAILDQSGHILDVQQGDLTRGDGYAGRRSRSSSVSVSGRIMEWGEEEDEDEEDEEQEGDTGEQESEEGEQEGAVEGGGEGTEDVVMKPPEAEEEEEGEGDDSISRTTKSEAGDEEEEDPSTSALGLLGNYAAEPQTPGSTTSALPDPSTPASESPADRSLEQSVRDDMEEDEEEDDAAVEDMMRAQVFSSPIQPRRARQSTEGVDEDQDLATPDDQDTDTVDRDPSQPPSTRAGSQTPAEESTAALVDTRVVPPSPSVTPDDALVAVPTDPADPVDSQPAARKEEEEEDTDVDQSEDDRPSTPEIPAYLLPYAVAPVEWDATKRVTPPLLLRGFLRPYQQSGLEWLASLHLNNLNGILADEMGLGKTIQTIALLAHLACDRGIWGPHLIIVPTSVLLNWEMEFKKFLPGFKVLSYHGSTKRRKDLRQGWNERHHFNVCITSYTLASRDAIIFKRKPWYYMILDEAHMIKNFKSQRWNTLLMFRSFRRLLLTGTPLQNNLTELWALLQFLMSGSDFVNLKEFGEWFSNPLERAIEAGSALDEDTMQRVTKLHTVLRPYLLRRLKRDVEKELPSKYEHLVLCPLSKRQRFLYDEFMSRAHTRDALQSGVYQKIANILMQLRKVCNHPDLFEVRPIVTSFAMERSAVADFEIKELLLRRRLQNDEEETVNLDLFGFRFIDRQGSSLLAALETRRLDGTTRLPFISEIPGVPPPKDTRTIAGFRAYSAYQQRAATISRWAHIGYLNRLRCNSFPIYSSETLSVVQQLHHPLLPLSAVDTRSQYLDSVYLVNAAIKSYATRADEMAGVVDRFAFVTPAVIARDLPRIALAGHADLPTPPGFDDVLHRASVKLQIAFPDPSLLQYDCGKLQQLTELLREKKAGGHRILIFTQMTKILDILEIYLNFHGYLYLRLDGATRIEDRQYITERFNADPRVFCFIASSRSGGVGINLTGADTVVFYDSDFNPQMDRQCEDRAHRIGQIRDVHIYRFVSQHTVEEAMLRKANQKRSLDDLVIQKGEFDWRSLFGEDSALLTRALGEFEDREDAHAAAVAAREEVVLEGQDKADFLDPAEGEAAGTGTITPAAAGDAGPGPAANGVIDEPEPEEPEPEEEGGTVADYMIAFVQRDPEYFREWKL